MRESYRIGGVAVLLLLVTMAMVFVVVDTPQEYTSVPLGEVPFEDVLWDYDCAITENTTLKITDQETWADLWAEIHATSEPVPDLPSIDFEKDILFAVFLGMRHTGGFTVNITRVILTETGYEVHVVEIQPGANCYVPMQVTEPHHIVRISGSPQYLPAEFLIDVTIYDCP
ncbi:MAG: protease complex subunit PrcB family protein [Candidatus Thorarchaeota archaeon]|jgi:hypothetical protein